MELLAEGAKVSVALRLRSSVRPKHREAGALHSYTRRGRLCVGSLGRGPRSLWGRPVLKGEAPLSQGATSLFPSRRLYPSQRPGRASFSGCRACPASTDGEGAGAGALFGQWTVLLCAGQTRGLRLGRRRVEHVLWARSEERQRTEPVQYSLCAGGRLQGVQGALARGTDL